MCRRRKRRRQRPIAHVGCGVYTPTMQSAPQLPLSEAVCREAAERPRCPIFCRAEFCHATWKNPIQAPPFISRHRARTCYPVRESWRRRVAVMQAGAVAHVWRHGTVMMPVENREPTNRLPASLRGARTRPRPHGSGGQTTLLSTAVGLCSTPAGRIARSREFYGALHASSPSLDVQLASATVQSSSPDVGTVGFFE